jgi:hypothetical protein
VAYNFQIGKNKIKLPTEYESVTQKVLLHIDSILPSFPSALQLRVSFGLLNNLPPFFSIPRLTAWFLNNLVFMV